VFGVSGACYRNVLCGPSGGSLREHSHDVLAVGEGEESRGEDPSPLEVHSLYRNADPCPPFRLPPGWIIPAPPTARRTLPRPPSATPKPSEGGPGGRIGNRPARPTSQPGTPVPGPPRGVHRGAVAPLSASDRNARSGRHPPPCTPVAPREHTFQPLTRRPPVRHGPAGGVGGGG